MLGFKVWMVREAGALLKATLALAGAGVRWGGAAYIGCLPFLRSLIRQFRFTCLAGPKKPAPQREAGLNCECNRCRLGVLDVGTLAQVEPPVNHQAH